MIFSVGVSLLRNIKSLWLIPSLIGARKNDDNEEEVLSKNGKIVWDKNMIINFLLLILQEKEN